MTKIFWVDSWNLIGLNHESRNEIRIFLKLLMLDCRFVFMAMGKQKSDAAICSKGIIKWWMENRLISAWKKFMRIHQICTNFSTAFENHWTFQWCETNCNFVRNVLPFFFLNLGEHFWIDKKLQPDLLCKCKNTSIPRFKNASILRLLYKSILFIFYLVFTLIRFLCTLG